MKITKGFDTVLGMFLMIIAVAGNFVAETLSCQTQKLISNDMYVKNIVILMIIYFSLGFTTSGVPIHPLILASKTIAIWVFFLLFNKVDIQYTMAGFVLLFFILVLKNYVDYYDSSHEQAALIPEILKLMDVLFVLVCLIGVVGFLLYFKKQYNDHKKDFSFLTFIFGKPKCASIE